METLNFSSLLRYGAIGLGCILAVLAYFLLRDEQKQAKPRKQFLTSIYAFMVFSLVLTILGFGAEMWKSSELHDAMAKTDRISTLEKDLADCKSDAISNQTDYNETKKRLLAAEGKMAVSHKILTTLLDLKAGKIDRLGNLQPGTAAYSALVTEIHTDLVKIDDQIRLAMKD